MTQRPPLRGNPLGRGAVTGIEVPSEGDPSPRCTETFAKPLNRPRLRAGACSFPGFLPTAMFVAGIWSTGTYPSSLGFAKAGPRSGVGTGN